MGRLTETLYGEDVSPGPCPGPVRARADGLMSTWAAGRGWPGGSSRRAAARSSSASSYPPASAASARWAAARYTSASGLTNNQFPFTPPMTPPLIQETEVYIEADNWLSAPRVGCPSVQPGFKQCSTCTASCVYWVPYDDDARPGSSSSVQPAPGAPCVYRVPYDDATPGSKVMCSLCTGRPTTARRGAGRRCSAPALAPTGRA
jgi:hypothetical protein